MQFPTANLWFWEMQPRTEGQETSGTERERKMRRGWEMNSGRNRTCGLGVWCGRLSPTVPTAKLPNCAPTLRYEFIGHSPVALDSSSHSSTDSWFMGDALVITGASLTIQKGGGKHDSIRFILPFMYRRPH